jgi:pimeloyl-ACP methyl ester carboxylesterase
MSLIASIVSYWRPEFFLGLLLDLLVSPLAGLLLLSKWLFPTSSHDTYFRHPPSLPAVLLVHGSGSNEGQWLLSRILFLRHGTEFDTFSIQLNDVPANPAQSIEDMANSVASRLDDLYRMKGNKKVILVGCSMGGLVAARATLMRPAVVAGIVTFGTPWSGAPALRFLKHYLPSRRHAEMTPGSAFLQTVQNVVDQHRVLCIGSPWDWQVPVENATPAGADCRVVWSGHMSMLANVSAWKHAMAFIRSLSCEANTA